MECQHWRGKQRHAAFDLTTGCFDGLIYTLDTKSQVSAFDIKTGQRLWQNDIRPKGEDEQVIGGGLASSGNILYATNGYNELLAINPKEGGIFWRKKLPSPSRAAPTVLDDRVFVLTLDNRLLL
jgi:outer membrane protein assembly factor BamB